MNHYNKTIKINWNEGMDTEENLNCKVCENHMIPDIKLIHEWITPLGKYECLCREYLKSFTPILYNIMWF